MKVILKEDGIMTEEIKTTFVDSVDGELVLNDRRIEITDRFCMEVHED